MSTNPLINFVSEHRRYTSTIERLLFLIQQSPLLEDQIGYFDLLEHDIEELKKLLDEYLAHDSAMKEALHAPLESASVLLIDSDPVQLMQTRDTLIRGGFSVQTAMNGKKAFDLYCENHFDLIVTECQLAELDGFLLTKAIRKLEHQKNTEEALPIVAYTSFGGAGYKERCIEVGMNAYLKKPLLKEQLILAINNVRKKL